MLDRDTRKLFIGLRETPYGFEGLTSDPRQVYALFQDQAIYERPSLDDIMVYTIKFGIQNQHGVKRDDPLAV